ncbi:hypothetical protein FNE06_06660 [Helicobacter pylori]|nr:hypothetical protein FNE06_05455 [Helicobacter pylori]WRG62015.1 hypothetical protein FNE06_06660 [Helicobacter pylori]
MLKAKEYYLTKELLLLSFERLGFSFFFTSWLFLIFVCLLFVISYLLRFNFYVLIVCFFTAYGFLLVVFVVSYFLMFDFCFWCFWWV